MGILSCFHDLPPEANVDENNGYEASNSYDGSNDNAGVRLSWPRNGGSLKKK